MGIKFGSLTTEHAKDIRFLLHPALVVRIQHFFLCVCVCVCVFFFFFFKDYAVPPCIPPNYQKNNVFRELEVMVRSQSTNGKGIL